MFSKALINAARDQRLKMVKFLLFLKADTRAEDSAAFRHACLNGNAELAELLLSHGADISAFNNEGICLAVANNHENVVKVLIDYNVDVAARNNLPIRLACERNNENIAKMLLKEGADPSVSNSISALHAAENANFDLLKLLEKHGADVTFYLVNILAEASETGDLDLVKYLLAKAPQNFKCGLAVQTASTKGQTEIVKHLLELGLDEEDYIDVALEHACCFGYYEIAEMLLKAGANPNYYKIDITIDSPLISACSTSKLDVVRLLISYGADVTICDNAAIKSTLNPQIHEILIQHGADPNAIPNVDED